MRQNFNAYYVNIFKDVYMTLQPSGRIVCRTGPSKKNGEGLVIIKFDGRVRTHEPGFVYVNNPLVLLERVSFKKYC